MLRGVPKSGNEQKDFRSLGLLMVRLMERSTSLDNSDSLELKHPEKWDDPIKSFLNGTARLPGEALQDVRVISDCSTTLTVKNIFLKHSPDSHCLKPMVLITEALLEKDWEVCFEQRTATTEQMKTT